jgi:hypothetical protein
MPIVFRRRADQTEMPAGIRAQTFRGLTAHSGLQGSGTYGTGRKRVKTMLDSGGPRVGFLEEIPEVYEIWRDWLAGAHQYALADSVCPARPVCTILKRPAGALCHDSVA